MPLNDLSLEDLTEISGTLVTLETVGRDLTDAGLSPRFDLTPGEAVTITTAFRMPAIESPKVSSRDLYERYVPPEIVVRHDESDLISSIKAVLSEPPSTEAAPPEPAPEPVDLPPAALQSAGGTLSAAPSRSDDEAAPPPAVVEASLPLAEAASSEGVADSGGGQAVAAAAPPAASDVSEGTTASANFMGASPTPPAATNSLPPTGSGERTFSGTAIWTPEEDARLIALVVSGVTRLGLTKGAAMKAAAHELGRPEPGTIFRCHHKLKDRLDTALAQGDAYLDQPEDAPEPTPSPSVAVPSLTPADGETAGEGMTPPAVQSTPEPVKPTTPVANELTGHLMSLPDKNGWTLERDLELMELSIAGWQMQEIALQLQVQANLIKPRFDQLTGLYEDASGKKVRRFTRETVFEALTRMSKGAA